MFDDLDLQAIPDENARQLIRKLLNLIEQLSADLRDAQAEIQRLRDEINRLKGEQGTPQFKAKKLQPTAADHSSEKERHKSRQRHKKSKKAEIKIDREEVLKVAREELPADAEFKGYEDVVVQDIVLKTDNVCFRKERFYSASTQQSYQAELPRGYDGQYGPGVKALVPALYFGMGTSEPKILEFLVNAGVQISAGQVSNFVIKEQGEFHAEKDAVYEAGLRSSPWHHADDTLTRVDGENQHCHVVCNPAYTVYTTLPHKDRLSVLDVLRNGRERRFCLNQMALDLLEQAPLSKKVRLALQTWHSDTVMTETLFDASLAHWLPSLGEMQRKYIRDASAIAAYHLESDWPVIELLVCDDAPQFNWLTSYLALCWVHEGRPYKKLSPVVPQNRALLDGFLGDLWKYYDKLLDFQEHFKRTGQPDALHPHSPDERTALEAEFDSLFATVTGYDQLDQRIAKTRAKKTSLLMVLQYPEIPLHNNPAELGARQRVRKRDISFGPRTPQGRKAWDTFMSLAETCKKVGVSFYAYLSDRIIGSYAIPPLAELVTKTAHELNLGQAWSPASSSPSY
jgi:hypothetical protein